MTNKASGPNFTPQKKAFERALVVLYATFEALGECGNAKVKRVAEARLEAINFLKAEDYKSSAEKATMQRCVAILWNGLKVFAASKDPFIAAVAKADLEIAAYMLREYKTRKDRPDTDLVSLIDGESNSLNIE